jgi:hypothetical protein
MPAEVTVKKSALLDVLRANREQHRDIFLEAQHGYRERVVSVLDQRLNDAREGRKINLIFMFPEPEDHTEDYDREIRMLEMHTGDEVTIDSRLFDQIVMDRWGWKNSFASSTQQYLSS